MSTKQAEGAAPRNPAKLKLFREGIAEMEGFKPYKDLVMVLLKDKKLYTPAEAKALLDKARKTQIDTSKEAK